MVLQVLLELQEQAVLVVQVEQTVLMELPALQEQVHYQIQVVQVVLQEQMVQTELQV